MIRYPITPCPAPRQVRRDAWDPSPSVQRYRAFKDEVRARNVKVTATPFVVFYMPMPPSWPKKRRDRMNGTPHMSRPDIDNLQKALFDAVFDDDSHIWRVSAEKLWSEEGSIVVGELEGLMMRMAP